MKSDDSKPEAKDACPLPSPEALEQMLAPKPGGLGTTGKLGLVVGGLFLASALLGKPAGKKASFAPGPADNVFSLGRAIRQRRNDLGMTQEQLAEATGVGLRFIGEVENGKATAQIGKVFLLLDGLDLQLAVSRRRNA
ncbi:MAG: helix-turn-helix domain-containing protein [Desulfovibrio sp.]